MYPRVRYHEFIEDLLSMALPATVDVDVGAAMTHIRM